MSAGAQLDHLVVLADSLEQGAAWCQRVLGLPPEPGGRHGLFGTHNSLLSLACADFPQAYLEIIAIDPEHAPQGGRTRWFDMDNPVLREQVRTHGPQLIHWVARCADVQASAQALAGLGIERGPVLQASRATPGGLLQWGITVRDDGQRLFDGCLPTLIQWSGVHPADSLPQRGLSLRALHLQHPDVSLRKALNAAGLVLSDAPEHGIGFQPSGPAGLRAFIDTPRGPVWLGAAAV